MAKVTDAMALKLGRMAADVVMAATGSSALGGRQSVIGKMFDTFSKMSTQKAEQEKTTKERAEKLELTPSQLKIAETQKKIMEQIEELKNLRETAGYGQGKPTSSSASILQDYKKINKESNKAILDAAEIGADAVDRKIAADKEQPKRMSDEVKKSGFASKFLAAIKSGLRETVTGERRKGAIQAALAGTGLGELEEVFGVSERLETFWQERKRKKEEKKKEEEAQAEKAKQMQLPLEKYQELLGKKADWEKKVEAHKERLEFGVGGFKEVEEWEEKKEVERVKKAEERKKKGLLAAGTIPKEIGVGEVPKGLLSETTSGLTEEIVKVSSHLEKVAEHTEGTRDEVRDLKTILTGSVDDAVKTIVKPIEEQKKATEQVVENTEKIKEAFEEGKKDKDKISLMDILGLLKGGVGGLLSKIPGLGGLGKLGGLGGKLGGRLLAGAGGLGGLAGLGGAGAAAGFGVHQAVQAFRGKDTLTGQMFGELGEAITGEKRGAGWVGDILGEKVYSESEKEKTEWQAKVKEMQERNKALREQRQKAETKVIPPTVTTDIKAKREGEVPPPGAPTSVDVKAAKEGEAIPVTKKLMTAQERALASTAQKVLAQRKAAQEVGLPLATTESQMQMSGVVPEVEQAPGFVMSRESTAEEKAKWLATGRRMTAKIKPGPEVTTVPGPGVLGGKSGDAQKPMIIPAPSQSQQPQATIQRTTYVDDMNIAITNQLMFQ